MGRPELNSGRSMIGLALGPQTSFAELGGDSIPRRLGAAMLKHGDRPRPRRLHLVMEA
jgi:hypothetical protein